MTFTLHKLKVVRTVNYTGPPSNPGYAECMCGWRTPDLPGVIAIGVAFDAHTDGHDAPRSKAPWRTYAGSAPAL